MPENIYIKIQNMRVELQKMNIKKSGVNKHIGYNYYELADILPPINEIQAKYKTCSYVTFNNEEAVLTIINAENPEEKMIFTSPMMELSLRAANPIQNLGGVETYQRRYLYMTAFEIVENDYFDAIQGENQGNKQPPPKPTSRGKTQKKAQISDAIANELNAKIKEYSVTVGVTVKSAAERTANYIGKPLSDINEEEAKDILEMLQGQIETYILNREEGEEVGT